MDLKQTPCSDSDKNWLKFYSVSATVLASDMRSDSTRGPTYDIRLDRDQIPTAIRSNFDRNPIEFRLQFV